MYLIKGKKERDSKKEGLGLGVGGGGIQCNSRAQKGSGIERQEIQSPPVRPACLSMLD